MRGKLSLLLLAVACAAPVVSLFAISRPAEAADVEAERRARRHFHKGESHFAAGRFAEALAEYEAGYEAAPLPGFLVNIAQCHRRLGDLKRARATYQKFVLVAPDSPLVPDVRALIKELDDLMVELGESQPPAAPVPAAGGATAAPQDGADGATQAGGARDADAATGVERAPRASALTPPGREARADVTLSAPPAPAAEETPRSGSRWWLWTGIAAVAVGGGVAAFLLTRPAPSTLHDGSLGTLRR